jgi:hypothetical protein
MLRGIQFAFKIITQMVMHNKINNFEKLLRRDISVILNAGLTTFLIVILSCHYKLLI